ncbi:MAG: malate synthase G, partial [Rhodobacteraceae bacterium]|nr:malate synthase G [Paracoccaceae bacterium]
MVQRVDRAGLQVDARMAEFVEGQALPGTGIGAGAFWQAFSAIAHDLAPKNRDLLGFRDSLQAQIDDWHRTHRDRPHNAQAYRSFLEEIGYLLPEGGDFHIDTTGVDPEIARIAGPQLVVPI